MARIPTSNIFTIFVIIIFKKKHSRYPSHPPHLHPPSPKLWGKILLGKVKKLWFWRGLCYKGVSFSRGGPNSCQNKNLHNKWLLEYALKWSVCTKESFIFQALKILLHFQYSIPNIRSYKMWRCFRKRFQFLLNLYWLDMHIQIQREINIWTPQCFRR